MVIKNYKDSLVFTHLVKEELSKKGYKMSFNELESLADFINDDVLAYGKCSKNEKDFANDYLRAEKVKNPTKEQLDNSLFSWKIGKTKFAIMNF